MALSQKVRESRHAVVSRAIGERLFISTDGRIFSVGGRAVLQDTTVTFGAQKRAPTAAEAPLPTAFGLKNCDGELTPGVLENIGRALALRRKELGVELRRRPKQRREIEQLERRLREAQAWSRRLAAGEEPAGAPYFLSTAEDECLRAFVGDEFPPLLAWQARMVYWLDGGLAVYRFVEAVKATLPRLTDPQFQRTIPAAYAGLIVADGSSRLLPKRLTDQPLDVQLSVIDRLADQINQEGYDRLLAAIDAIPGAIDLLRFHFLRSLLAKGESIPDLAWASEHGVMHHLPHDYLEIADIRRLHETFAARGWPFDQGEFCRVLGAVKEPDSLTCVEAWLTWLGSVSPRTMTPRLRKLVSAGFWETYWPNVQRNRWLAALKPWIAPASRRGDVILRRVAAYQQRLGRAEMPKSLRKLSERSERQHRERDYLCARRAAGTLPAEAQARLTALERNRNPQVADAGFRRAAEESFLRLGIETLRAVVQRLADDQCRTKLPAIAGALTPPQRRNFAGWLSVMSVAERDRVQALFAARKKFGRTYKRHLADNLAWIVAATESGVNLAPWFAAEPLVQTIGGREMEIVIADDLADLFRMGDYFGTCLSVGDINELSVITNAYDANKQVVFLFARDDGGRRTVLGRQLIAISSEFKLVRYRCYLHWRHAEKSKRDEGLAAIAAFCGRLAAKCGLELSDTGTPEVIANHFWYDDDEAEWSAAARAAWDEARNRPRDDLPGEAGTRTSEFNAQAG